MIYDTQSLFSDAQAVTATAASTNVIDLGVPGTPMHAAGAITQDVGRGREIPIRVQVVEAFNNLTTLTIAVQIDTVENFASPKTVMTIAVPLASLAAGYVLPVQYLPLGTNEQFVRLNYTVTGTAPTTGKITAGLVFGNENWSA